MFSILRFRILNSLLIITLVLISGLGSSFAQQSLCGGTNMLEQIAQSHPKIFKIVQDDARVIPYSNGGLWKIQKDGGPASFLFGTMHLSDPRVLEISENTKARFDAATTLALEIQDIVDPERGAKAAGLMMKYAVNTDGKTFESKISKDEKTLISNRIKGRLGMPWSVINNMRPWFVMTMVALPECELTRQKAGQKSLDVTLGLMAKEQGKTIIGLETTESQLVALSSLPEKLMIEAVLQAIRMGDRQADMFETMISLYQQGKFGTIWAMMRRVGPDGNMTEQVTSSYSQFQRSIVDQRNVGMADGMEPLIQAGGAFVAVGALHLPGEKGILNILAQRGYTITAE